MDDRVARSRAPLDEAALAGAIARLPFYGDVRWSAETGSTNADVAALARAGAPEGTVRTTDLQTAGRGRLTRTWSSPPGAGIAVSVLLRPSSVPRDRWTWLPLLAGVAVAETVERAGAGPRLKWPNDVLVDGCKIAGILVEVVGDAVVVGIGLNVTNEPDELPSTAATSLRLAGAAQLDRTALLADLLRALAAAYVPWRDGGAAGGALPESYAARSATVGNEVRVALPGGATLTGLAEAVDDLGRLVVSTPTGTVAVGAGEVVHVR